MIVLDTNVISEVMRLRPDEAVMSWLERQPRAHFYLSSISFAEIAFGIEVAPGAVKRGDLAKRFQQFRDLGFGNQVLSFDENAARRYVAIAADRQRMGRPISEFDAQIAAIAVANGFSVATRNVRDFEHCGISIINPWTE